MNEGSLRPRRVVNDAVLLDDGEWTSGVARSSRAARPGPLGGRTVVVSELELARVMEDEVPMRRQWFARRASLWLAAQGQGVPRCEAVLGASGEIEAVVEEDTTGVTLDELLAVAGRLAPRYALAVVSTMARAFLALEPYATGELAVHSGLVRLRWDGAVFLALHPYPGVTSLGTRMLLEPKELFWMSPERLRGVPSNPFAEMYAVGAALDEMLAGPPQRPDETPVTFLVRVATGESVLRGGVAGGDVEAFVRRCAHPNPAGRHAGWAELTLALEDLTGRHGVASAAELAQLIHRHFPERVAEVAVVADSIAELEVDGLAHGLPRRTLEHVELPPLARRDLPCVPPDVAPVPAGVAPPRSGVQAIASRPPQVRWRPSLMSDRWRTWLSVLRRTRD